ncbi:Arm DNA-binding domain-containing protein [Methylocella tundrae]|nr:Arm DNA-binding domain-containing protein [Methylocella tundrae]
MPKRKITDIVAAAAEPSEGQQEQIYWDTDVVGFGLRVRPSSKTWIMAYRPAGAGRSANTKKLRLSTFPSVKTVEARRLAREIAGRIAAGEDPAVNRTELKRKETSSVGALLDRYGDDLARRGYVNRVTVINGLEARLAPFKARDIKTVSGADLWAIIEALQKVGKEGAAEDFRSRARAFFTAIIPYLTNLPGDGIDGCDRPHFPLLSH